jgi:hypothetical protein
MNGLMLKVIYMEKTLTIFRRVYSIRQDLGRKVVQGLCPDGMFVLGAYTPKQLVNKTGGSPAAELTMKLSELRWEPARLRIHSHLEDGAICNGESAAPWPSCSGADFGRKTLRAKLWNSPLNPTN